jgi:hypothetical protein
MFRDNTRQAALSLQEVSNHQPLFVNPSTGELITTAIIHHQIITANFVRINVINLRI